MRARAAGLALGYALDRLLGDPARFHPVAGFGRLAQLTEAALYRDSRRRGAVHVIGLVGSVATLGVVGERLTARPGVHMTATTVATWVVLGGRSLEREALAVESRLASDDVLAARTRVRHLVGRDTAELDAGEIARAVIESVAENCSDAVVAPLVWGAVAGLPGLLGYRAINTLDAMVGHHNDRYERFGWAAARLDDLVNLPASRLAALLVVMARPGRATQVWRVWRRDAGAHPSPNAGVVEAAYAGALGIRLGGRNRYYGNRVEDRVVMGDGRAPGRSDIAAAVRLARRVGFGASVVAAAASWALSGRRGRSRRSIPRRAPGSRGSRRPGRSPW